MTFFYLIVLVTCKYKFVSQLKHEKFLEREKKIVFSSKRKEMSGSEKEKVSGSSRGGGMVGKPGAVARDDSDHGSVKKHMSKKELEELRKKVICESN